MGVATSRVIGLFGYHFINGSRMFLMFCFHSRHAIAGRASEDKLELTSSAGRAERQQNSLRILRPH
jgi:hypothetical protein